jgi:hypothetical protein
MCFVNTNKDLCSKGWVDKLIGKKQVNYTDIFLKINKIFQNSRLGVKEDGVKEFYNEDTF